MDELHDERFVRLHVRELFGMRSSDIGDASALGDVWAYLLTTRKQLAFLAYLCVKRGVCERTVFFVNSHSPSMRQSGCMIPRFASRSQILQKRFTASARKT